MPFRWKSEYATLARQFLEQHFGGATGLTETFPCLRTEYTWGSHRPQVADSRVPAKNNTEYQGLERHASQYHATAQYEFSYHYWLMAAFWRRVDAQANNFSDAGHDKALEYCLRQAQYNNALSAWQKRSARALPAPTPEYFGLRSADIGAQEKQATQQLDTARAKRRET